MAKYEIIGGVGFIPQGVTKIEDEAFYYCENLTSIVIPDSVTTIGDKAFWGCKNLTSIEIGNSVI
ncbi:MAG: leucine-rich repeat domain-containing protein, partial [Muribaculaceae bacterium]|nr:leucine-rich repeat domain-containing protein [Muribaculaceae bacterium]